jgi:hypothetical protein
MSFTESVLINSNVFKGSVFTLALIVSSVSFVVTLTEFFDSKKQSSYLEVLFNAPAKLEPVGQGEMEKIYTKLSDLKEEVASMKGAAINVPVSVDVSRIEENVAGMAKRLALLESAISNNPEKALAVPMLRKDHEALVKQFNDSIVASKLDYDRLWSMLMLLLTTLGGGVVLLSGWALKSIFTKTGNQASESL